VTDDKRPRPPRPERPSAKTMAAVAAWGAGSALIAYFVGRGTVGGMVIVFAVLGVGLRVWDHWYRRHHPRP